MLETHNIEYHHGDTLLEGYYAFDKKFQGKRPAVLITHDWSGHTEFTNKKAEKLAELGYVGFALDMFGKGKIGTTVEEKQQLIAPLVGNRTLLRDRMLAALETVKKIDIVDITRIGAMGFCFGGLCTLDLARSGADVLGAVSFHGLLNPPNLPSQPIKAKILALHGHDDPMVQPDQVLAFEKEMTAGKVDWQVHVYGNTQHAFTNPKANDPKLGTIYNSLAEKRSWIAMKNFFAEVFA